jgi:hypothetical protein
VALPRGFRHRRVRSRRKRGQIVNGAFL